MVCKQTIGVALPANALQYVHNRLAKNILRQRPRPPLVKAQLLQLSRCHHRAIQVLGHGWACMCRRTLLARERRLSMLRWLNTICFTACKWIAICGVVALGLAVLMGSLHGCGGASQSVSILNVSYDPTREFYKQYNNQFVEYWKAQTGQSIVVRTSHGGSGKQARSVIEGLEADVVTLALALDIDVLASQGRLLAADWQRRLPHNSCPYTSTIVLLTYRDHPRGLQIRDWPDLLQQDVEVVTPNPKTSGGARWNYLAAWGYALKRELGDWRKLNDPACGAEVAEAEKKAEQFVTELFARVRKLDTGAREATLSFIQGQGDVLLAWENEALWVVNSPEGRKFKMVVPSVSILAEPPVAVVDTVVDRRGTRRVAEAYLEYLYSPAGQTLAAVHHYRPVKPELVPSEHLRQFAALDLFTVEQVFGGWSEAHRKHFAKGGICDRILAAMGR